MCYFVPVTEFWHFILWTVLILESFVENNCNFDQWKRKMCSASGKISDAPPNRSSEAADSKGQQISCKMGKGQSRNRGLD